MAKMPLLCCVICSPLEFRALHHATLSDNTTMLICPFPKGEVSLSPLKNPWKPLVRSVSGLGGKTNASRILTGRPTALSFGNAVIMQVNRTPRLVVQQLVGPIFPWEEGHTPGGHPKMLGSPVYADPWCPGLRSYRAFRHPGKR